MNNLAIIPARSGSKGIIDKNIRLFGGRPLMAYSIEAAIDSHMFSEIMVSTDSSVYAEIAQKYGAKVPFLRGEELSSDSAGSWDVVDEVIEKYLQSGKSFDSVCLLQPTSPLRDAIDIVDAYNYFTIKECAAVTSVCELEHSIEITMELGDDYSLNDYRKNHVVRPRQLMPKSFRINGAIYIRRVSYSDERVRIIDSPEYAFVMDRSHSVDIDEEMDFVVAEAIYRYLREEK